MAQFSCLFGDAKKDSFTALSASFARYIEDIAYFALADSDLLASCSLGARSHSDVELRTKP